MILVDLRGLHLNRFRFRYKPHIAIKYSLHDNTDKITDTGSDLDITPHVHKPD